MVTRSASSPCFEELPFAGHPTLGTAWYLRQHTNDDEIILDLKVGKIPVRFERRDGLLFGEMRQAEPEFGRTHSHADVAKVLGVAASELDENIPIQTVSTGMPFTIVPFRSLGDIAETQHRLEPDGAVSRHHRQPCLLLSRLPRDHRSPSATLHARMIFYNGEDPATGSAAGCCTAWAVKHGVLASETQGMIEQGIETRRPSYLYIRADEIR